MKTHNSAPATPSLLSALFLFLLAGPCSAAAATAAAATAEAAGRRAASPDASAPAPEKSGAARAAHGLLGSLASDENACSAQADTCLSDVMCLECMTSYVDHPIDYQDCIDDYEPDWPSATACDVKAAQPCCFDLVSRGNCLESGSFLEYWGCWFEEFNGCSDYELTCAGTEGMFEVASDESGATRPAAAAVSSLGSAVAGLAGIAGGTLLLLP